VLGVQDEVWWSRLAQPNLHTWTAAKPLRLIQHELDRHDPEPKAVARYGLLRADTPGMLLRFVDGRPIRAMTTQCLAWLTARLAAEGNMALLLVWDKASWPVSQAVPVVAQGAQPSRQAGRRRPHRGVSLAEQASLAEPPCAHMGAWQAGYC
jgi:hypothetical protein